MWRRLESLPVLVIGTLLTTACATVGWTLLRATLAGPPPSEAAPIAMKTVLIRVQNRDLGEVQRLLMKLRSERGRVGLNAAEGMVRITDLPWFVERMRRIVHEVDEWSSSDHYVWTYRLSHTIPDEVVEVLARARVDIPSRGLSKLLPSPEVSKVLPANREHLLIIVADRDGSDVIERFVPQLDQLIARPLKIPGADRGRMPPDGPDQPESGPIELPVGPLELLPVQSPGR